MERSAGVRVSTRKWKLGSPRREWRVTLFWGVREWNWYFGTPW